MVTGPSRAFGGAAARTGRDGHHRPLWLSRVVTNSWTHPAATALQRINFQQGSKAL